MRYNKLNMKRNLSQPNKVLGVLRGCILMTLYNMHSYMMVQLFTNLKVYAFSRDVFSVLYAHSLNIALWFTYVCANNVES